MNRAAGAGGPETGALEAALWRPARGCQEPRAHSIHSQPEGGAWVSWMPSPRVLGRSAKSGVSSPGSHFHSVAYSLDLLGKELVFCLKTIPA